MRLVQAVAGCLVTGLLPSLLLLKTKAYNVPWRAGSGHFRIHICRPYTYLQTSLHPAVRRPAAPSLVMLCIFALHVYHLCTVPCALCFVFTIQWLAEQTWIC
jgi:hypothetical protein